MQNVRLFDGIKRHAQTIDEAGASLNIVRPLPPFGGTQKMRAFRQFLTTDGTATGTSSMLVNGSSTNVDFYVPASETKDRYITTLSFVIADQNATLSNFGAISALTNGCQLLYEDEEGTVTIHDALKSNFNFIRLCQGNPPIGDGASAFLANNVSGNSEAYMPVLDFREVFGFQWGLRLAVGTRQRITFRIRDNVSGIDQFDAIAYGFERSK